MLTADKAREIKESSLEKAVGEEWLKEIDNTIREAAAKGKSRVRVGSLNKKQVELLKLYGYKVSGIQIIPADENDLRNCDIVW